jgi:hypothetical protein
MTRPNSPAAVTGRLEELPAWAQWRTSPQSFNVVRSVEEVRTMAQHVIDMLGVEWPCGHDEPAVGFDDDGPYLKFGPDELTPEEALGIAAGLIRAVDEAWKREREFATKLRASTASAARKGE